MATPPPSSDGHQRRPGLPGADGGGGGGEARDWAELPRDALLAVLQRLDHVDLLVGAGAVCVAWRRAARDEPELWRRVVVRPRAAGLPSRRVRLGEVARVAVRRCAGRCEAFCGEGVGDYGLFLFLGETAPLLKSLRLISCSYSMICFDLKRLIPKFTLLEELELSLCSASSADTYSSTCEAAGQACPHLKRLRLSRRRFRRRDGVDDAEAMAVANMRGLRSLQLFANRLGDVGLAAVLDGCPELERLDIRHCFNVDVDDADEGTRARCARMRTLRLPGDSMEDYDLPFESPDMEEPVSFDMAMASSSGSMCDYGFRGDILWDSW